MIGDNLSQTTHQKLRLWGTVVLLGFYLLCIVQAKEWGAYSLVCGPLMLVAWTWGLGAYKRPRQTGKVTNFGTLSGFYSRPVTGLASNPSNQVPAPQESFHLDLHQDVLTNDEHQVLMYDRSFRAAEQIKVGDRLMGSDGTPRVVLDIQPTKSDQTKSVELPTLVRSRYKRVSDPSSWAL